MNKLEAMKVFLEVAIEESFVGASRKLGISAPAVTRSIAELEKNLGVSLFVRTTRHVRLTDSGQRYFSDVKRILDDVEEAEAAVTGSYTEPKGVLTVTAPVQFGQKHIAPIITEYLDTYPAVSVRLVLFDRVTNLMEEGIDLAIRIGELPESSLYANKVGSVKRVICGSPDYFSKHGTPSSPAELANHHIVLSSTQESATNWQFSNDHKDIVVKPRLYCNQIGAAIAATVGGAGITRLLSYQVGEEIEKGDLQCILEDFNTESLPINIVHLEGRRANAKIRTFIDLATVRLRANTFVGSNR